MKGRVIVDYRKETFLEGVEHHAGNATSAAWQIPLAGSSVLSPVLTFNP